MNVSLVSYCVHRGAGSSIGAGESKHFLKTENIRVVIKRLLKILYANPNVIDSVVRVLFLLGDQGRHPGRSCGESSREER